MARLSNPAILFEIPIALVRMLVAPFFYIFVYLFSVATNILHYVFRNQADSLGFTAWRNHTRSVCDQENNKLSDACSVSATSRVLFVTVEVHLLNGQTSEISEIALSRWSPGRPGIETVLWMIENDGFDAKQHNAHNTLGFLYGETKTMPAAEISIHLTETFQDFRKQFERVYLVGYKIHKALSHMENIWTPPKDIVTIDTERVWQAQHQESAELPFKQCIERIPHLREYSPLLGNTGNKARLNIQLLRVEVEDFSLESNVPMPRGTEEASTQRV
ncbi:hypothetical protein F4824DRAFT_463634 [Ustulina deusta]|nr:hypothetical protein F4824DRAFT_463634 [Ustulina deusta]